MRFLTVLFFAFISFKAISNDVNEELKYNEYRNLLATSASIASLNLNQSEQKLFVDALEDALYEGFDSNKITNQPNFSLVERLRLEILKVKFQKTLFIDTELAKEILSALTQKTIEERFIYILSANEQMFLDIGEFNIISAAKNHSSYFHLSLKKEKNTEIEKAIVTDLYFNTPAINSDKNGKYKNSVKIYMFCRSNRLFPCLMIMRDLNGKEIRNPDQSLWSHPVLAVSKHGLPSFERNGNTPAGIFTIDSVMPSADQQKSFGQFRRMMLNFIPKSNNETTLKSLLPKSSWQHSWWSASPVARDIGRSLFRIHGTGEINTDPNAPFYPFIRTSGCIANKENTYDGITYQDQRILLDSIMTALKLKASYANEVKIKGVLYLVELNEIPRAVSLEDLHDFEIR
jgi:hypothetical protein